MSKETFESGFRLTEAQKAKFATNGYVKLPVFLSSTAVDMLLRRTDHEMSNAPDNFKSEFNRLTYDFESRKDAVYDLIATPAFQDTLTSLTGGTCFSPLNCASSFKAG